MTRTPANRRWRYGALRRLLRPANRPALDAWVRREGAALTGLVLNVGSGGDRTRYGRRTIRIDAFSPQADVRADLASALPFRDTVFDAVICTEVIEHVPDAAAVLADIHRVLRPGGRLLCTVPFVFHFHPDPADFRRFTPPGLARDLEAQGFHVEFLSGTGGKATAFLLLIDSLGLPVRIVVRAMTAPFAPLLARRRPRAGKWSDYAANAVAIARRPA